MVTKSSHTRKLSNLMDDPQIANLYEKSKDTLISKEKLVYSKKEVKILKYIFRNTIPLSFRLEVWLIASGAKRQIKNNPGYYEAILCTFPSDFESPFESQIDLDLNRTFPNDEYFRSKEVTSALRRVLIAFSRRNMSVGYCQGFNFIAARLLKLYKDEETVFWLFTTLLESILPLNYFTNLAGVMIDCGILNRLIRSFKTELYAYLTKRNMKMHLNNLIYKWFVSAFVTNTSEEVAV